MYLIRLKIVGNCCIPDLDDFMIYCGNDRIVDLEEFFSEEQLKYSLRKPGGHLRQMLDAGIVEEIRPGDITFKMQQRMDKQKAELQKDGGITNKKTIKQILEELHSESIPDAKSRLAGEYFDNLSVLDRVIGDKSFPKELRDVAVDYMHKNLNKEIDQKFVLI
jgi:hypothetical protein